MTRWLGLDPSGSSFTHMPGAWIGTPWRLGSDETQTEHLALASPRSLTSLRYNSSRDANRGVPGNRARAASTFMSQPWKSHNIVSAPISLEEAARNLPGFKRRQTRLVIESGRSRQRRRWRRREIVVAAFGKWNQPQSKTW